MELNWRSRNDPSHLWSLDLWQRIQNHSVENSLFNDWCWFNLHLACNMQCNRISLPFPVDRNVHCFSTTCHACQGQCRLSIKFTTLFVIPHAIYTAVPNTVQTPEAAVVSPDYVSWLIAKIISSCHFVQLSTLESITSLTYPPNRLLKGETLSQHSLNIQTAN